MRRQGQMFRHTGLMGSSEHSQITNFFIRHLLVTVKSFLSLLLIYLVINGKDKSKSTRKKEPPLDPKRRWIKGGQMVKIHQWKHMSQIGLKQEKYVY